MSSAHPLIAFGGACVVGTLVFLALALRSHRRARSRETTAGDGPEQAPRTGSPIVARLGSLMRPSDPEAIEELRDRLAQAGVYSRDAVDLYQTVRLTLSVGTLVAFLAMLTSYLMLSMRRSRRLAQIDSQLPQALELVVFSLRAGRTLEDSIQFAAQEQPDPIGAELERCCSDFEMGRAIQDALVRMSARLAPCKALRNFVEAVLVLKQTGGNIAEVIDQIIDTLRAQAAYESRYRALTAEGRTSGLILSSLPLLVLAGVLLLEPGYLTPLLYEESGRIVLLMGLGLWTLGVAWLQRLARPPV